MHATLKNFRPISFTLTECGVFPKAEFPRTLWVGLNNEDNTCRSIVSALDEALMPLGFEKEKRDFSPHITIGRLKSSKNRSLLSKSLKGYTIASPVGQSVDSITLFKSTLRPEGPIYEMLDRVPLGK